MRPSATRFSPLVINWLQNVGDFLEGELAGGAVGEFDEQVTDGGGAADDAAERGTGRREGRPMADRSGWKIGGSRCKIKMSSGCLVNESVSQINEFCRLVKTPELGMVESAQAVVASGYVTETIDVVSEDVHEFFKQFLQVER